jgi:Zn-dependent peptidase ImmA (M78 family)
MTKLTNYRIAEIRDLAEAVSRQYFPTGLVKPEWIGRENRITYSYGYYDDSFDGLLQHRMGKFHIYLNLTRNPDRSSPRMRFTFAHELGHYFIDEHRNAIRTGKVREHPSFNSLNPKNQAEAEADYFASCLLMPGAKVKEFCRRKPLSSTLIEDLGKQFQTSTSAVIYKYMELSLFPMLMVMSRDGKVQWKQMTQGFKYWGAPKTGKAVPVNSAAGEYYQKGTRYKTEEIVFADDWFNDQFRIKDEQFWEKCYYLGGNKVMSLIWKKER